MNKEWYKKKWVVLLMHIAAWTTLFYLPTLLRPSFNPGDQPQKTPPDSTIKFILFRFSDILLVAFFYLNALVLFPRLVYRKKYLFYFLSITGCMVLWFFQSWFLMKTFTAVEPHYNLRKHILFSFFVILFILACSIAYRTIRDKIVSDNLAKEKENEFLKTELALLRSQVSPHFMFNVLNNMVALARKQSDLLEPSLIKLSSLMRYMLYETDEEKVTLEKEMDYLQNYIDLQQQRFGKKVTINTNFNGTDKTYFIEPMLLIPFVENAFKHGTGMIEQAMINIELSTADNKLQFVVQNRYNPDSNEIKDKASGIGLTNVGRRLELLYKDNHQLKIDKTNNFFTVTLQINLTK